MKTLKLVALAALTVSVVAAHAQDVSFKRTFKDGMTEKYSIATQINVSSDLSAMGQGEMTMAINTSMDATYTYSDIKEDGSALLKFIYNNITMKAEGPMADMMGSMGDSAPREITGSGRISPFGKMTEVKTEGAAGGMMQMMTGGSNAWDMMSMFSLPSTPVKVGGTWESELPSLNMFAKGSKLTGKLVGPGKLDGSDIWIVEFTGQPKMSMDIGKMMQENPGSAEGMPPMNMVMEGTVTMKTTISIDQATGQVLKLVSASDSTGAVKLPDMGLEIPNTSQSISTMTLKK